MRMLQELTENSGEPSVIWQWLERAVMVLMGAAAVALIVYAARRIYRRFYTPRIMPAGDLSEFAPPDIKEWFAHAFRPGGSGPAHRIRRMFYRKVRKYIHNPNRKTSEGITVAPTDTALEMAAKIKAAEDIDALTAEYLEVRYSRYTDHR
jgi:hypothetical protein